MVGGAIPILKSHFGWRLRQAPATPTSQPDQDIRSAGQALRRGEALFLGGGAPLPSKAHRKEARKFDIPICLCWFATPSAAGWICDGHVDFIQFCWDFTSKGPHVLIEILPSWDSDP